MQLAAECRQRQHFFCGMQAQIHLDSYSQRGFEVVFGGDLNWIEEERGPMQLLPGWCDALRRSVPSLLLLHSWAEHV